MALIFDTLKEFSKLSKILISDKEIFSLNKNSLDIQSAKFED